VSVIDEPPPGRTPVVTRRVGQQKADDVWEFVRKQVKKGRQAYVVYPLVEGPSDDQPQLDFAAEPAPAEKKTAAKKSVAKKSAKRGGTAAKQAALEGMDTRAPLRSASEMYDHLRLGAFADLRVGLLHGRMAADDKEITMRQFQRGEIDVLIATTVIEVGVDVPNATVMVIEHAERFGLAQMHQLRGRVGRGAAKSYCVLMTGERVSEEAEQRLDAMVRTQNGFELAEIDLQQRGPGEFFGTRQAGMPDLRVASLVRDRRMLEIAKAEAQDLAAGRLHDMTDAEREMVRTQLKEQWQRRYGLVEA
jgi:ATP-dependent DNA helicase RecG